MIIIQQTSKGIELILSPNRSLSWLQAKWIIAIMVFIVLVIALAWSLVGAWLILPFAGLEVGLFAILMYQVAYSTHRQQIVRISPSHIDVSSGVNKQQTFARIKREGLTVEFSQTELNWRMPIVSLVNHGDRIRIGDFLNRSDLFTLKQELSNIGLPVCNNHWWKAS